LKIVSSFLGPREILLKLFRIIVFFYYFLEEVLLLLFLVTLHLKSNKNLIITSFIRQKQKLNTPTTQWTNH
jgi:hypothetical protein